MWIFVRVVGLQYLESPFLSLYPARSATHLSNLVVWEVEPQPQDNPAVLGAPYLGHGMASVMCSFLWLSRY